MANMWYIKLHLSVLLFTAVVKSAPTSAAISANELFGRANYGEYSCTCASRKQQLTSLGATPQDIAIAMLENGSTMEASDYSYGDGKTEDSANFGIFKNNWYMIRTACSQFSGQTEADWNNGAVLNSNDQEAITCQHEQQSKYPGQQWWGGQRDGQSGLSNDDTTDINNYKTGVLWIESQLNEGHLTDDEAFYYDVVAI